MRLEDGEKGQARDAGEAEAVDAHRFPAMHDGLIAPHLEPRLEVVIRLRVGFGEEAERPLGEHHAPAVGRAGGILLDHADLVGGVFALEQQREVESGRPAAHDGDAHRLRYSTPGAARWRSGLTWRALAA
jgi:hypothetical protein